MTLNVAGKQARCIFIRKREREKKSDRGVLGQAAKSKRFDKSHGPIPCENAQLLSLNQSVENAGVAFVKGAHERNEFFEKKKKKQ